MEINDKKDDFKWIDTFLNKDQSKIKYDNPPISWCNGGYKIIFNIKRFFKNPKPKKELNLLEQVDALLQSNDSSADGITKKCEDFIWLHRIIENTRARRRLEKWVTHTIVWYLIIVLIVVISSSLFLIFISDTVLITILSTTTVNIIGLGAIIMRGHFSLQESGEKHIKNKENNNVDNDEPFSE